MITEKSVHLSSFPYWLLFSSYVSLQLFVLSSFISVLSLVRSHKWKQDYDCIAVRKMKTIRVQWIVPLSPSHCFCWWAMGTWQTMGMIGGMGAARRRTGNREQETMSSRRQKRSEHAQTERRLWSSCRNCGMKTWKLAMQLKVKANWKFGCWNWKAFNNKSQKHTCIHTHTHTLECHDLFSNPVGNRVLGMHLPTYSVSSGCDQYAPLCDCG